MPAPTFIRRLSASFYEFALLFGIYFITGLLVQALCGLLGQTAPRWLMQLVIFVAFGLYFSHSWQKAGQTLAQRTWRIKVLNSHNQLPNAQQAWLRYIAAYLGLLPALLILEFLPHNNVHSIVLIALNWLTLLGTAFMSPQRRALHEVISKTRSVYLPRI
ncbi:MAG: RDD family protein [Formosimonas sp.]